MLRFKPEALGHRDKRRPSAILKDIGDCFSDDWDDQVVTSCAGRSLRIPASHVSLMEAQQGVKAALFNRLLVDDVSFDERHFYSQSALFLAAQYDSTQALELLVGAGENLNMEDRFGETALFQAVSHSAVSALRWLLQHEVDVGHKTPEGETALHVAAMTDAECLGLLLEAGADVNAPKTKGTTPLMMAAVNHTDCVARLIHHGADVNAKSIFGDTAMLYAVRSGNVAAVKLLVKEVDDIEYGGLSYQGFQYGCVRMDTPLGIAVNSANPELVDALLLAGADANGYVKNADNNVLHLAVGNTDKTNLERIQANHFTSTTRKTPTRLLSIVRSLVHHGAVVDSRDEFQQTPLMVTSCSGDLDIMEFLLQQGADANASNCSGFTPLYLAARREDLAAVRLLMQSGAVAGWELHHAVVHNQGGVVRAMVDSGAAPCLRDVTRLDSERPLSPLYVALRLGRLELAAFLISRSFVTRWDLVEVPRDLKLMQVLNEAKFSKAGVPEALSQLFDFQDFQTPTPPSLFLWSFVAVSECLGDGGDRLERVKQTGLCVPLQNKLMFQEGNAQLCSEGATDSEEGVVISTVREDNDKSNNLKSDEEIFNKSSEQELQVNKNNNDLASDIPVNSEIGHLDLNLEDVDEHTIVLVNENAMGLDDFDKKLAGSDIDDPKMS